MTVRCKLPTRLIILFGVIVALSSAGCVPSETQTDKETAPSAVQKLPHIPKIGGETKPAAAVRIPYFIRVRMITVQVPAGLASKSEELWSYLDEEPVSMKSTVLGINGIRVGMGRAQGWPDIERILKQMTGLVYQDRAIQSFGGQAKQVELKTAQPEQTICIFREDMTLFGADYPKGDNILAISCTIDEDNNNRVILTAVPQLRTTKNFTTYVHEYGNIKAVSQPKIYPFRELTFQMVLPSDDFIIIGPGIESRRLTSLGHHFLTENIEGLEHETILVLRPEVVRIEYNK